MIRALTKFTLAGWHASSIFADPILFDWLLHNKCVAASSVISDGSALLYIQQSETTPTGDATQDISPGSSSAGEQSGATSSPPANVSDKSKASYKTRHALSQSVRLDPMI